MLLSLQRAWQGRWGQVKSYHVALCVHVPGCASARASISITAFPPTWRVFAICEAAFTFFTRYRRALHLLLLGFFLFRHDVSFLAASTVSCSCETGTLRGLQSLGAGVWF